MQRPLPARGAWVEETRRLTPTMAQHLVDLLDALGFDPKRVADLRVTPTGDGLIAHVTHVRAADGLLKV